jgi:hypothetical protein
MDEQAQQISAFEEAATLLAFGSFVDCSWAIIEAAGSFKRSRKCLEVFNNLFPEDEEETVITLKDLGLSGCLERAMRLDLCLIVCIDDAPAQKP